MQNVNSLHFSSHIVAKFSKILVNQNILHGQLPSIRSFFDTKIYQSIHPSEKVYDIYLPENDHRHITQSHLPKEHRLLYRFYHNPINHSSSLVPILIFIHGGGFLIGDILNDDVIMSTIQNETGFLVVGINYALAPENPYPTALYDVKNAFEFIYNVSSGFGGNISNIHVLGESAGGNLALGSYNILPNHIKNNIKSINVIYPPVRRHKRKFLHPHYNHNKSLVRYSGYNGLLNLDSLFMIYENYVTTNISNQEAKLLYPIYFNYSNITNILVILAEKDILYDDGIKLFNSVKRHIHHDRKRYLLVYNDIHGFYGRFGNGLIALNDTINILKSYE